MMSNNHLHVVRGLTR